MGAGAETLIDTMSPPHPPSERRRDAEFARVALPLLPTMTRIARALARDDADGDDVVQETYLRAYRYWHTFEQGTDCRRWLTSICRNVLSDMRRRQAQESAVDDADLETLAAARLHNSARSAGLGDMYSRLDLGPAIARAIGRLDPIFRDIVVLSDVEGLSYQEIAAALMIPIGTVRSRLYRARRQLQESLMAYAIDAGFGYPGPAETPRPVNMEMQ